MIPDDSIELTVRKYSLAALKQPENKGWCTFSINVCIFQVSDSIELRTIKACSPKLESFLKSPQSELVHFLSKEGFFHDGIYEQILDSLEDDKTPLKLTKWIRNRVRQYPLSFHCLVGWFKDHGPYYKPLVGELKREFSIQRSISPSTPSFMDFRRQHSISPSTPHQGYYELAVKHIHCP